MNDHTKTWHETAASLAEARLRCESLADFPGPLPETLDEAYQIQRKAIELHGGVVAGWKVGRLSADLAERFGVDRFIGPIFAADISSGLSPGMSTFPMFEGGSAAFEAEYVYVVSDRVPHSLAEVETAIEAVHIGIEVAASPIRVLPELGSLATIADFGNNNGLILGSRLSPQHWFAPEGMTCVTSIDGVQHPRKSAAELPGGPLAALWFAWVQAGKLGLPLKAGQFVSTGAVTGMHAVAIGQSCLADFGPHGTLSCLATAARPALQDSENAIFADGKRP